MYYWTIKIAYKKVQVNKREVRNIKNWENKKYQSITQLAWNLINS